MSDSSILHSLLSPLPFPLSRSPTLPSLPGFQRLLEIGKPLHHGVEFTF